MRSSVLAFLFGILFCQTLSSIPDIPWTILSLFLVISFTFVVLSSFVKWIRSPYRLLFLFALGLLWTIWRVDMILAQKLPQHLEGQDLTLNGTIIALPEQNSLYGYWRFNFAPNPSKKWPNPGHLRLSWYDEPPQPLRPGQLWQLTVRLKQAHGMLNPGTFDYTRWLFQQRILTTGYVRSKGDIRLLSEPSPFNIDHLRYRLREKIRKTLGRLPNTGIIIALMLGTKQDISQQQKDILQQTGTAHLMAISGLHIGFIAWLTFWIAYRLWSYAGKVVEWLAAPRFAALISLSAAFVYALLAGFSLPTQRALIMVAVVLSGIVFARKVAVSQMLALALLLVLLWDPLSVLSAGFWLSFGAVTVIIYALSSRREQKCSPLSRWGVGTFRTQWAVTLGLFPILLAVFSYIPLLSPFANAIAIPWFSFVVPLTLLGTAMILFLPTLGSALLHLAVYTVDALWVSMDFLANVEWSLWQQATPPLWTVIVAVVGIAIILLPRGFPGRYLGIVWLLPIFFISPAHPNRGEVWFTLLDVGQGLAAVVRTENYVLVYDTGPKFRSGFNTGDMVVVPFLRAQGIQQIDRLLISHGDSDHNGGAESILEKLTVDEILTNAPELFEVDDNTKVRLCQVGQHWRWDEVDFQILHPPAYSIAHAQKSNNQSCVLKVSTRAGAILLSGDIEKTVESRLVQYYRNDLKLKADILIAPHHGSGTSSTESFIDAVQPTIALFSAGYRNRFGHPKKYIVQRYRHRKIKIWNTAHVGAIQFQLSTHGISDPGFVKRRFWRPN